MLNAQTNFKSKLTAGMKPLSNKTGLQVRSPTRSAATTSYKRLFALFTVQSNRTESTLLFSKGTVTAMFFVPFAVFSFVNAKRRGAKWEHVTSRLASPSEPTSKVSFHHRHLALPPQSFGRLVEHTQAFSSILYLFSVILPGESTFNRYLTFTSPTMPPKRSSAKASNQPTIAFHGRSTKITKPNARDTSKKALPENSPFFKAAKQTVEPESPATPEVSEVSLDDTPVVQKSPRTKTDVKLDPEEELADKISEAQINKYWREKEKERKAPRVHQEDLTVHEKVLRSWDISGQYGVSHVQIENVGSDVLTFFFQPAIGIARTKRWHRAHRLGLKPPIEVLAVLMKEQQGKQNAKAQRAYVDELLS